MPRNVFRNGASLHRVLESAPIGHLKEFLYQADENFIPVGETVGPIWSCRGLVPLQVLV